MKTPEKLWKLVLEDLQVSISKASFNSFLLPLQITATKEIGDNRIIVEIVCPSTFHQQIIDRRYYAQLKDAIDRITEKAAKQNRLDRKPADDC